MKPITVLIHKSESNLFKNNSKLLFTEFEKKANYIALKSPDYDIDTHITVIFDDDSIFDCILGLSHGCKGFEHHVKYFLGFWEWVTSKSPNSVNENDAKYHSLLKKVRLLKKIEFATTG